MGRVKTHGRRRKKKICRRKTKNIITTLTPQEKLDRLPPDGAKKQRLKLEYGSGKVREET